MILCHKCNQLKEKEQFHRGKNSRGRQYDCKVCSSIRRKAYYLKNKEREKVLISIWYKNNQETIRNYSLSKYGITQTDYNNFRQNQDYCCAICREHETTIVKSNKQSGSTTSLHVDHNHTTGEVRGLLCFRCNSLLGKAHDNSEILQAAIEYLQANV